MVIFELLCGDVVLGTIQHDPARYESVTGRRCGAFQAREEFGAVQPLFDELSRLDAMDSADGTREPISDHLYSEALKPILEPGMWLRNVETGQLFECRDLHLNGTNFRWAQAECSQPTSDSGGDSETHASDNVGYRWASKFSVDTTEVEAEFDAEAAEYDEHLNDWDYRVPEDSTEILSRYVRPSAKILEAGCGTGLAAAMLHRMGYRNLYGCDLSRAMLGVARSKEIYGQLLQADLCQRLPYDDDAFDAITCLATLSFIEDAEPTFREFCRVSRREGIILFSHRHDLFVSRDCLALCQRLEREGVWERELHTDWREYIPGHPAYTDELLVGYFVYRVKKSSANSVG